MKKIVSLLLALFIATSLTACGGGYSASRIATNDASFAVNGYSGSAKESAWVEDSYYSGESSSYYDGDREASIIRDYGMIVRTASLSVDVTDLDEFATNLEKRVQELGGYFEENDIENYASAYSTNRYGRFTVRVPQENLDTFLGDVEGESFVTSRSLSSEDVSLEYVDVQARIDSLKVQQETLMRLLEEAVDISATLQIEERLSDVNYEIDRYIRQQRTLAGKVSYSTVRISAHEERNVEHPIRLAFEVNFRDRMIDGIEEAVDTFVSIITAIPTIAIVCAFGIFFLWLIRKIWRKVFRRSGNRQKVRYMLVPMVQTIEQTNDKNEIVTVTAENTKVDSQPQTKQENQDKKE